MAVTDPQKANLLANTIKNNFIENNRMQDNYDQDDEVVTSTVNTFLSSPPSTQIEPAMPDEIINFIKNTSSKKAPAVMRPILAYACPVWGYAAKTNINILNTLQNSYIRMIVNACRYMKNDRINKALKITSFKAHIQKLAINFFDNLPNTNNANMLNLNDYNCNDNTKRPRRILLDSYNPP
ncbi:uncharacterized protein TNCV_927871 [Trichonephila clavipes]|nr:uncharacterized protein TNCV_927871 [Trichonephila clavipes]